MTETSDPNPPALGKRARAASWFFQLVAAAILGQTLFFKFTGAPEAVALFETLGAEPWGRLGLGVVELVTVLLLLWPGKILVGALLALALMVGALGSHLAVLGIEVDGDGGLLFALALTTLASAAAITWLRRGELASLVERSGEAKRALRRRRSGPDW